MIVLRQDLDSHKISKKRMIELLQADVKDIRDFKTGFQKRVEELVADMES